MIHTYPSEVSYALLGIVLTPGLRLIDQTPSSIVPPCGKKRFMEDLTMAIKLPT